MLKDLIKLANHLDKKGLTKEADYLDGIITKLSQDIARTVGVAADVAARQTAPGSIGRQALDYIGDKAKERAAQHELANANTMPLQEHSAFRSAESAGSQAAMESVKTKASTAMGKTLDFYEQEVLPKLRAGQQVRAQITEPLLIGLIKPEDKDKHRIFAHHFDEIEGSVYQQVWLYKTAGEVSDKDSLKTFNHFIDSNGRRFNRTEGELANLKTAYNLMEQSVIEYGLNVPMQSFPN